MINLYWTDPFLWAWCSVSPPAPSDTRWRDNSASAESFPLCWNQTFIFHFIFIFHFYSADFLIIFGYFVRRTERLAEQSSYKRKRIRAGQNKIEWLRKGRKEGTEYASRDSNSKDSNNEMEMPWQDENRFFAIAK